MARTQALDYDRRREAIMQTAARLYAERGFLGTSVAQIAVACKTSKSLLYHYYQSKEDILFDVMDSHVQSLVEAVLAIEKTAVAPDQKIRRIAAELMQLYVGAGAHQKVLLNELVNLPEERRKVIVDHQRLLLDAVGRVVVKARPDLAKTKAERRAVVMLFFGMLNWTHTWYDPAGPVKPGRFAEMASDMFLNRSPAGA